MTAFPNPTTLDNVNLMINVSSGDDVLVIMVDNLGREVYSKINIIKNAGEQVLHLYNLNSLMPGIYQVIASSKQSLVKRKLVIQ